MNKEGLIDIKKAYLGTKELSPNNAFVGTYPLLPDNDDKFRILALEDDVEVRILLNSTYYPVKQYSFDGNTWTNLPNNASTFTIDAGDKIYVRGKQSAYTGSSMPNPLMIEIGVLNNKQTSLKGKISYLIDYQNPDATVLPYDNMWAFLNAFYDITDISLLKLQYTTINAFHAFEGMFRDCPAITTTPVLPAITSIPAVPGTLGSDTPSVFAEMFAGCSNLNKVVSHISITYDPNPYLPDGETKNPNYNATNFDGWLDGVAGNGVFYNLGNTNFPRGNRGIPYGWTIQNV